MVRVCSTPLEFRRMSWTQPVRIKERDYDPKPKRRKERRKQVIQPFVIEFVPERMEFENDLSEIEI